MSTEALYTATGENTGNLAYHHALPRVFGRALQSVPWHEPERAARAGDVALVPCANQLGPHVDLVELRDLFARMPLPMVAIGLGAQGELACDKLPEIPPGSLGWLQLLARRAPGEVPNVSLRGEFSRRVLEAHGLADRAMVLGCPSLFINPDPALGRAVAARLERPFEHIAVAAGHFGWKHMARLEASLGRMLAHTGGSYVVQSPRELVMAGRGEADRLSDAEAEEQRDYVRPDLNPDSYRAWARRHVQAFFNIDAWMEHLRRFDLIVGTRIHGVLLALQAGVPGLCIASDSRTREMCETMMVPHVLLPEVADGIEERDLPRLIRFDGEAFDANRRRLGEAFVRFLNANGLQPGAVLTGMPSVLTR